MCECDLMGVCVCVSVVTQWERRCVRFGHEREGRRKLV